MFHEIALRRLSSCVRNNRKLYEQYYSKDQQRVVNLNGPEITYIHTSPAWAFKAFLVSSGFYSTSLTIMDHHFTSNLAAVELSYRWISDSASYGQSSSASKRPKETADMPARRQSYSHFTFLQISYLI